MIPEVNLFKNEKGVSTKILQNTIRLEALKQVGMVSWQTSKLSPV